MENDGDDVGPGSRLGHVESFHVQVGVSDSDGSEAVGSAPGSDSQLEGVTAAGGETSHTCLISLAGEEKEENGVRVESKAEEHERHTVATEHVEHAVDRGMQDLQLYVEEGPDSEATCWQKYLTWRVLLKVAVVLAYLALVLILVLVVKVQDRISELERFGDENQALGGLLIILIYASTVVFYLPGAVLTIVTAGLLFNFWLATFLIWTSAVISQTIAFLLGRYVLQQPVLRMASKYRLWKALEDAITEQGFVVTMLCRAPGMPYNTINYVMGVTEIKFWVYSLASAVGVAPKIALYVYFGETLGDAIRVISGTKEDVTRGDYIRLGLSMGLAILAFALVIFIMQWALRRKLREMKRAEASAEASAVDSRCGEEEGEADREGGEPAAVPVTRLEGGREGGGTTPHHHSHHSYSRPRCGYSSDTM
eukprot:CAMPEP_0177753576 /NCGR_PEP_ID=MMETSP0491_2-20121128/1537_1 /TAXON_ID=63592 /ORGANISM="Tetraselmis chuii, Strain PLY429" /LENGTH=423 /DNA_ID=CAMNT_0019268877 /DNA_START=56 /DNA_END=1327 /DNA_ORIENTATION=+